MPLHSTPEYHRSPPAALDNEVSGRCFRRVTQDSYGRLTGDGQVEKLSPPGTHPEQAASPVGGVAMSTITAGNVYPCDR